MIALVYSSIILLIMCLLSGGNGGNDCNGVDYRNYAYGHKKYSSVHVQNILVKDSEKNKEKKIENILKDASELV